MEVVNSEPTQSLTSRRIGRQRLSFTSVSSTNALAAAYAHDPNNHGLVITADAQTAGRGQYERTWQAPAGSSVLMSVLLFPSPRLRRPSLLTAWAAISVCETIRQVVGLQATIKWPNDVLIDGKKVCGILCEAGAHHVVAGLGLNVNQTHDEFGKMNLPDAASLALCAHRTIDVRELTECLIGNLDLVYQRLIDNDVAEVKADWRRRIGLHGRLVRIEKMDGGQLEGTLRELSFEGVVVEQAGQLTNLAPEIIRHMRAG